MDKDIKIAFSSLLLRREQVREILKIDLEMKDNVMLTNLLSLLKRTIPEGKWECLFGKIFNLNGPSEIISEGEQKYSLFKIFKDKTQILGIKNEEIIDSGFESIESFKESLIELNQLFENTLNLRVVGSDREGLILQVYI